jgi:hypothetical protein
VRRRRVVVVLTPQGSIQNRLAFQRAISSSINNFYFNVSHM